eukprot:GFYU01012423.1.p1 GENE.GFYU01012423.1~~GFYU01012423.1.p1  ORF type:complete len:272 (-),score=36.27 GFYU01012423.1:294-1109(-)
MTSPTSNTPLVACWLLVTLLCGVTALEKKDIRTDTETRALAVPHSTDTSPQHVHIESTAAKAIQKGLRGDVGAGGSTRRLHHHEVACTSKHGHHAKSKEQPDFDMKDDCIVQPPPPEAPPMEKCGTDRNRTPYSTMARRAAVAIIDAVYPDGAEREQRKDEQEEMKLGICQSGPESAERERRIQEHLGIIPATHVPVRFPTTPHRPTRRPTQSDMLRKGYKLPTEPGEHPTRNKTNANCGVSTDDNHPYHLPDAPEQTTNPVGQVCHPLAH